MKVVIMAGGKGTRISSVTSDIPKPMIKIEGIPVLEREIKCLKDQGFDDIIMTVSHLGNIIMDYFGDGSGNSPATGKPFGVHIEYYFEKEPLGNAGALFKMQMRCLMWILTALLLFTGNVADWLHFLRIRIVIPMIAD